MGFMAGFGPAFSDAFNNKQQQDAVASEDEFKVAYDAYTKNKTQYDADKKADDQAKQQAKDLVAGNGLSPDAWTYAYKWLRLGYTPDQIDKKLATTKFMPIPTTTNTPTPTVTQPAIGDPNNPISGNGPMGMGGNNSNNNTNTPPMGPNGIPSTPGAPASDAIGQQMSDSGLAPSVGSQGPLDMGSPPDASKPATGPQGAIAGSPSTPQNNDLLGNLASNISDKFAEIGNPKLRQQHQVEAANQRVMGATGTTPDQMAQYNKGYTPEPVVDTLQMQNVPANPLEEFGLDKELSKAKVASADAQAAIMLKSGDPDQVAKANRYLAIAGIIHTAVDDGNVDPNDPTAPLNIAKLLQPEDTRMIQTLATQKGNIISMKQSAESIATLLEKNGPLNTWAAQGMTAVNNLQTQIGAVLDAGASILQNDPSAAQSVDSFSNAMNQWMATNLQGWDQTSKAERELQSEFIKFQYIYAKQQLGQSGNAQTNTDIKNAKEIVMNSPNPGEAIMRLKQLVGDAASQYDAQVKSVVSSSYGIQEALKADSKGDGLMNAAIGALDLGATAPDVGAWTGSPTSQTNTPLNPTVNGQPKSNTPTVTGQSNGSPTKPTPPQANYTPEQISSAPIAETGIANSQAQVNMLKAEGLDATIGARFTAHTMPDGNIKFTLGAN